MSQVLDPFRPGALSVSLDPKAAPKVDAGPWENTHHYLATMICLMNCMVIRLEQIVENTHQLTIINGGDAEGNGSE